LHFVAHRSYKLNLNWAEIRNRVDELRKLDSQFRYVSGASSHKYLIAPCIDEKTIRKFETEQGALLPDNYKNYLQVFGAGGVGPGHGIDHFPDRVWPGDLTKPFDFEFKDGFTDVDETSGPLFDLDGLLRIGSTGRSPNYLIVTGKLTGNVVNWGRSGIICLSGPFDRWFKKWLDSIFEGLREIEQLKHIQLGMHRSDILSMNDLIVSDNSDDQFLKFKYSSWWVELGPDNLVKKTYFHDIPLGQKGFTCWSESQSGYIKSQ